MFNISAKKLQKHNLATFVFCETLAENYLENLEVRFSDFFHISSNVAHNAAVAVMSYSRFKGNWIACINLEYHSEIKSIFKGAAIKEIHDTSETLQDITILILQSLIQLDI